VLRTKKKNRATNCDAKRDQQVPSEAIYEFNFYKIASSWLANYKFYLYPKLNIVIDGENKICDLEIRKKESSKNDE